MAKRIFLGLFAMLVTGLILDALPNPYGAYGSPERFLYFSLWPTFWGGIEIGFAAFVGAYVANVRFVIPAIFFTVMVTVLTVIFLHDLAEPFEPQPIGEIVGRNSINFVVALGGAIIGAKLGTWIANRRQ
jgi:hypothetical protein